MFPVAVACGNTFVLKPSEKDPGYYGLTYNLSCSFLGHCFQPLGSDLYFWCLPGASIMLAELALEAGLPDGVLNIVHGTNVLLYSYYHSIWSFICYFLCLLLSFSEIPLLISMIRVTSFIDISFVMRRYKLNLFVPSVFPFHPHVNDHALLWLWYQMFHLIKHHFVAGHC